MHNTQSRTKCLFCRCPLPPEFIEEDQALCPDCIDECEDDADEYIQREFTFPRNTLEDDYREDY